MENFFLMVVSFLLAGFESFLPGGSVVIGWSAVVGVKKSSWWGVMAVLISGLVRDVILVNQFGLSSAVAITTWLVGRLGCSRFDRPFVVAGGAAVCGSLLFSLINQRLYFIEVGLTGAIAGFLLGIWRLLGERGGTIRLRRA